VASDDRVDGRSWVREKGLTSGARLLVEERVRGRKGGRGRRVGPGWSAGEGRAWRERAGEWAASGGRGMRARGREREGGELGPDSAQPRGKGFYFFFFFSLFLIPFLL
jgi:hypothetical protein